MDTQQISYIKQMASIDNIEQMSIMDSSAAELLLFASSNSNANIFYLYAINKDDGTIAATKRVDSGVLS